MSHILRTCASVTYCTRLLRDGVSYVAFQYDGSCRVVIVHVFEKHNIETLIMFDEDGHSTGAQDDHR